MTAAIWIAAAWIVAAVMTALGLCALIGANQSVERATRYADGQKQRADEAEEEAGYWFRMYARTTNVRPITAAPSFDRIAAIIAANEAARDLDQLDTGVPEGWGQ